MFPCPNPTCTHAFSPEAVKGASSLVCPKCGTVFQFASSPGAAVRPSAPPPPPAPAAVPIAQPVAQPDVPRAAPVGARNPASFNFNSTPEMVVPRPPRRAGKRGKRRGAGWLLGVAAGVVGLVLAVWGGLWLRYFLKTHANDEGSTRAASAYNARFALPGKPWMRDKDIQMRLHVHIGMKSSQDDSGLGLVFKDYKTRRPGDAEMLDDALSKLRSYFRGLEWELKSNDEQARLAGHSAQVVEFQGVDSQDVTMNGECHMMAFRGYGYWFFTWAPLGELESNRRAIHGEWARLRRRLELLDGRKGWTEKPRETEKIAGKKASYRIAYVKDLWTREPAEDYDAQADLVLKGHEPDPKRKPLAGQDATVQVLVLPKQADLKAAAAAARAYVKQRERKLYEQTTLEPLRNKKGIEIDGPADIGTEHLYLSKLRMKNTSDLERYVLLAVVNRPRGVVALLGDCSWERRDFWDQEFMALLKTFKVR